MKILCFFFGFLLLFPFFAQAEEESVDHFFRSMYEEVSSRDEEVYARVARMLEASEEEIRAFAVSGDLSVLGAVCHREGESEEDPFLSSTVQDCATRLHRIILTERAFLDREDKSFFMTKAMLRYWDGELSGDADFDILVDILLLKKQFFGSNAELTELPSDEPFREKQYLLDASNYRLPDSMNAYKPNAQSCDADEQSVYGGLFCVPKFCEDVFCITIREVPGRRNVPLGTELSAYNILTALEKFLEELNAIAGLTPTENTSAEHVSPMKFSFLDGITQHIDFRAKRPPFLEGFERDKTPKQTDEQGTTPSSVSSEEVSVSAEDAKSSSAPAGPIALQKSEELKALYNDIMNEQKSCDKPNDEGLCESIGLISYVRQAEALQFTITKELPMTDPSFYAERDRIALTFPPLGQTPLAYHELAQAKDSFHKEVPEALDAVWSPMIQIESDLRSIASDTLKEATDVCRQN